MTAGSLAEEKDMGVRIGLFVVALLLASGADARAQTGHAGADGPKTEVSGGYAFLRETPPGGESLTYPRGWMIAGGHQLFFRRLLVVGEAGFSSRANIVDETQRVRAILAGARVRITRTQRLATFGQLLVGSHRFSEPGFVESGLAVQPGVGLDLGLTPRLGLRAQVDYRLAREGDFTFKQLRAGLGAVVGFDK
jgi:hypothetical protein